MYLILPMGKYKIELELLELETMGIIGKLVLICISYKKQTIVNICDHISVDLCNANYSLTLATLLHRFT